MDLYMTKVLIVDDHPAIRMAVNMLLKQDGHDVIGEVDNGVDAIAMARKAHPDIVILDIGIPQLDGIEVIKRIKVLDLGAKILVLSAQSTHHIMLLKDAIAKIEKRQLYYPRDVIAGARHAHTVDREDLLSTLSSREMSVLLQICQGHANKQIAQSMLLSEKTVSTYKTRLMKKLNITNIVDLISLARRQKLL